MEPCKGGKPPLNPQGMGYGTMNTRGGVVVTPPCLTTRHSFYPLIFQGNPYPKSVVPYPKDFKRYSTLYFASKVMWSADSFPHWLSPPPPGAVQTLWA